MKKLKYEKLYEQVCHKDENLPLKIYKTNSVYLHWHEEYEFIMVEKGTVLCVINGETIELNENKALLLHSGDLHSIHNDTNANVIAIVASPSFWADELFASLFGENIKFHIEKCIKKYEKSYTESYVKFKDGNKNEES